MWTSSPCELILLPVTKWLYCGLFVVMDIVVSVRSICGLDSLDDKVIFYPD
jgi:hypothetical protein